MTTLFTCITLSIFAMTVLKRLSLITVWAFHSFILVVKNYSFSNAREVAAVGAHVFSNYAQEQLRDLNHLIVLAIRELLRLSA